MTNSFAVKKVSKAYTYNITSITYPSIAYAYYILRQVLSKSNHRQINDQNIPKQDAFDAIIQIFENPNLKDNDWTDQCLAKWDKAMKWMLPSAKKTVLLYPKVPKSGLNQVAWVVAVKREREKAAEEAAIAANTPSTSSPDPAPFHS